MFERGRLIGRTLLNIVLHPKDALREKVATNPRKILEEALRAVGYSKGSVGFALDLHQNGWYGIPQREHIRKEVEDEVLIRLRQNARLIPDDLIAALETVGKVIAEFSYVTYLNGMIELMARSRSILHNDKSFVETAEKMRTLGLIGETQENNYPLIYLTPAVDPMLSNPSF